MIAIRFLEKRARSYWLCIKANYLRPLVFAYSTFVATFVASRGIPPLVQSLAITLAVLLIVLATYISNDLADLEIDVINRVPRPLAQGKVSKSDVATLSAILYLSGVLVSSLINLQTMILCIIGAIMGIEYSFPPLSFKRRSVLKTIVIGGCGSLAVLAGGAAVNELLSINVLFASTIFFIYAMAFSPILDIGDIAGDMKEGRRTLPIIWGPEYTIRFSIALSLAIFASFILGYLQLGFNIALPILGGIVCLSCIYVVYPLFKLWRDQLYCRKVAKKVTLLLYALQSSLLLGSIF